MRNPRRSIKDDMRINLIGKGAWYDKVYYTLLEQKRDFIPTEHPEKADLLLCVGYPKTIKNEQIAMYEYGVLNIHPTLPQYRGRHPIVWAMMNCEKEIDINIHYIQDETLDTGDIIVQDSIAVTPNSTYKEVIDRLADKLPDMLYAALNQIELNCVYRRKQIPELAKYWRRRTPGDSKIPEGLDAEHFTAFVNALSDPMPNAYMQNGDKKICLKQAKIE